MAGNAAPFSFCEVMQTRAQENALLLDGDQRQLIAALDTRAASLLTTPARFAGLYVWGRPGRGKSFIVDNFYASLPVASKKRAHFHDFFRELHQRMMHQPLEAALRAQIGDARLLCFDEFHLHDPGDAMLAKKLLEVALAMHITLILTSNYSPRELLSHPLYHELFVPSIALIEREMTIFALNGERDYRLTAGSDAGCSARAHGCVPGRRPSARHITSRRHGGNFRLRRVITLFMPPRRRIPCCTFVFQHYAKRRRRSWII
ncbi:ATPase [Cronobacter condimenti 1330]|uniref:ATPase n=1 Tax=Cronobacter condimenti 1330 TaxID=1073999 RepID=K8A426_9ENTR|nr:ATPase [Cronobacter condimenti 1330]